MLKRVERRTWLIISFWGSLIILVFFVTLCVRHLPLTKELTLFWGISLPLVVILFFIGGTIAVGGLFYWLYKIERKV